MPLLLSTHEYEIDSLWSLILVSVTVKASVCVEVTIDPLVPFTRIDWKAQQRVLKTTASLSEDFPWLAMNFTVEIACNCVEVWTVFLLLGLRGHQGECGLIVGAILDQHCQDGC